MSDSAWFGLTMMWVYGALWLFGVFPYMEYVTLFWAGFSIRALFD